MTTLSHIILDGLRLTEHQRLLMHATEETADALAEPAITFTKTAAVPPLPPAHPHKHAARPLAEGERDADGEAVTP